MRGLATAQFLYWIEHHIGPIRRKFDLIVGTSTGAITAIALGLGIPAHELVRFYQEDGPKIFKRRGLGLLRPKYSAENMIRVLERKFNCSLFRECETNVMACATNCTSLSATFFKSWKGAYLSAARVAAASSAAPTYFNQVCIDNQWFCDGGLFANNPAAFAASEALELIGPSDPSTIKLLDIATPSRLDESMLGSSGALTLAPKLVDAFINSGMDASTELARRMFGEQNVYRVLPELGAASRRMDDTSTRNQMALKAIGDQEFMKHRDTLLSSFF